MHTILYNRLKSSITYYRVIRRETVKKLILHENLSRSEMHIIVLKREVVRAKTNKTSANSKICEPACE